MNDAPTPPEWASVILRTIQVLDRDGLYTRRIAECGTRALYHWMALRMELRRVRKQVPGEGWTKEEAALAVRALRNSRREP